MSSLTHTLSLTFVFMIKRGITAEPSPIIDGEHGRKTLFSHGTWNMGMNMSTSRGGVRLFFFFFFALPVLSGLVRGNRYCSYSVSFG